MRVNLKKKRGGELVRSSYIKSSSVEKAIGRACSKKKKRAAKIVVVIFSSLVLPFSLFIFFSFPFSVRSAQIPTDLRHNEQNRKKVSFY